MGASENLVEISRFGFSKQSGRRDDLSVRELTDDKIGAVSLRKTEWFPKNLRYSFLTDI